MLLLIHDNPKIFRLDSALIFSYIPLGLMFDQYRQKYTVHLRGIHTILDYRLSVLFHRKGPDSNLVCKTYTVLSLNDPITSIGIVQELGVALRKEPRLN